MIALPDRRQDVGAMMLRQLVWRVHKQVGDGSATTAVLAQAILHQATRMVVAGAKPVLIQRGIEKAVEVALKALDEMAQPVRGQEELAAVAEAVACDLMEAVGFCEAHVAGDTEEMQRIVNEAVANGGNVDGDILAPFGLTEPTDAKEYNDAEEFISDMEHQPTEPSKKTLH